VETVVALPDGRLASGARIAPYGYGTSPAASRAPEGHGGWVRALAALPDGRLVASDALGRLHWLEIVE
jgi:hypothetical protein